MPTTSRGPGSVAATLALALGACAAAPEGSPKVPSGERAPAAAPSESPRLPNGEPVLRMPFPAGVAAFCQQGNASPPGHSHAAPNAHHALDLSTPGRLQTPIVAAASGKVVRVVTGAIAGARLPGGGFGNQVVVDHGRGFTTFYAHLADVSAREGEAVAQGAPLGTMGETGQAGNVHLHFSLHAAPWPDVGAPETAPMHALVTADARDLWVGLRASLELECADSNLSRKGRVYASENQSGVPTVFGPLVTPLRDPVTRGFDAIAAVLAEANALSDILAELPTRGPQATRDALEKLPLGDRDDLETLYWIVTLSVRDLADAQHARAVLPRIDSLVTERPADVPPWLTPWLLVRRAELALLDAQPEEAKRHFEAARAAAPGDEELARYVAERHEAMRKVRAR